MYIDPETPVAAAAARGRSIPRDLSRLPPAATTSPRLVFAAEICVNRPGPA